MVHKPKGIGLAQHNPFGRKQGGRRSPRLVNKLVRQRTDFGDPAPNEGAFRVLVPRLFYRIIDSGDVHPSNARLHLDLWEMYARFEIGEKTRQGLAWPPPILPEMIT